MSKQTVSASGEAMRAEGLTTRRAALGLMASLPVLAGAAVIPTEARAASPELLRLIERHQAVFDAFDRTVVLFENQSRPDGDTLIPSAGCNYEARLGRDDIHDHIERDFAAQIKNAAHMLKTSPSLAEEAAKLLQSLEAACYAQLEDVFADYAAAEAVYDAASEAETSAMMNVCSYRCTTMNEVEIRAEYLVSRRAIEESLTDEHQSALLRSFLPRDA